MEMTNKIQCPSCGATSAYTETEPGQYKCGFCFSSWEQLKELPEENDEQDFFERCESIYDEQQQLKREQPKYFERTYANISIFYTFLLEIENPEFREKLLPKLVAMINTQMEEYAQEGIDANVDRDKIFAKQTDKFVLIIYLAELNYMLAKVIALNFEDKEKLEEAVQKLKVSQQLHGPTLDEWQQKISKAIVGILQRLGEEERTFEYIHSLFLHQSISSYKTYHSKSSGFEPDEEDITNFINDRKEYYEELKSLFDEIINSEAYQDWESKQDPLEEELITDFDEGKEHKSAKEEVPEKSSESLNSEKRSIWKKLFG